MTIQHFGKTFSDELAALDSAHLAMEIHSTTPEQVADILAKPRLELRDFYRLISPAAESFVPQLAQRAHDLTLQRFGRTVQFYLPLYLSNLCSNYCSYCGFSLDNKIRRMTLTEQDIAKECEAIKSLGFEHILLVTGESENKVGMAYFQRVLPIVREYFQQISLEVQPLTTDEYAQLQDLGASAVYVYQETYLRSSYGQVHLKGKKTDFDFRLQTPDRLGQLGMQKIGLGCLLGLSDWRVDSALLANHLVYLQNRYWQSKYSISFPRLRPCGTGFQPNQPISDKQFIQLISAFRLLAPEVELSLSTREPAQFRDQIFPLGITHMSAGSSTQPGGYANPDQTALEQFAIDDLRSPMEVAQAIQQKGYQVVWKDWDRFC